MLKVELETADKHLMTTTSTATNSIEIEHNHPVLPTRERLTFSLTPTSRIYGYGNLSISRAVWDEEQRNVGAGMDLPSCWASLGSVKLGIRPDDVGNLATWISDQLGSPSMLRRSIQWQGKGRERTRMTILGCADGSLYQLSIYHRAHSREQQPIPEASMVMELTENELAKVYQILNTAS